MTTALAKSTTPVTLNLNECLQELSRHGYPRLMQMNDNGWYCAVDMKVTAAGATFQVKSEYDHESPDQAANQCVQRMRKALEDLS